MIVVKDCADSTVEIQTDAALTRENIELIKDVIRDIYAIRDESYIIDQARVAANEDLDEDNNDDDETIN